MNLNKIETLTKNCMNKKKVLAKINKSIRIIK